MFYKEKYPRKNLYRQQSASNKLHEQNQFHEEKINVQVSRRKNQYAARFTNKKSATNEFHEQKSAHNRSHDQNQFRDEKNQLRVK